MFGELERASRSFALNTELHLIYHITPAFCALRPKWKLYVRAILVFAAESSLLQRRRGARFRKLLSGLSSSERTVAERVGISFDFLTAQLASHTPAHEPPLPPPSPLLAPPDADSECRVRCCLGPAHNGARSDGGALQELWIHCRFFTALVLHDLIREVPLEEACTKYDYRCVLKDNGVAYLKNVEGLGMGFRGARCRVYSSQPRPLPHSPKYARALQVPCLRASHRPCVGTRRSVRSSTGSCWRHWCRTWSTAWHTGCNPSCSRWSRFRTSRAFVLGTIITFSGESQF